MRWKGADDEGDGLLRVLAAGAQAGGDLLDAGAVQEADRGVSHETIRAGIGPTD